MFYYSENLEFLEAGWFHRLMLILGIVVTILIWRSIRSGTGRWWPAVWRIYLSSLLLAGAPLPSGDDFTYSLAWPFLVLVFYFWPVALGAFMWINICWLVLVALHGLYRLLETAVERDEKMTK